VDGDDLVTTLPVSLLAVRDAARLRASTRRCRRPRSRWSCFGTSARTPISRGRVSRPRRRASVGRPLSPRVSAPGLSALAAGEGCARDLLSEAVIAKFGRLRDGLRLPAANPDDFNSTFNFTRVADLVGRTTGGRPAVPMAAYRDSFGNCAPASLRQGVARRVSAMRRERYREPRRDLPQANRFLCRSPEETLLFLLGSRTAKPDRLSETAWISSGGPNGMGPGSGQLRLCPSTIAFGYEHARMTRTALEAFTIGPASAATTHTWPLLCRLHEHPCALLAPVPGDIGVPPPYGPMDSRLGSRPSSAALANFRRGNNFRHRQSVDWRGRDASDVAISSTFRPQHVDELQVMDQEVRAGESCLPGSRRADAVCVPGPSGYFFAGEAAAGDTNGRGAPTATPWTREASPECGRGARWLYTGRGTENR